MGRQQKERGRGQLGNFYLKRTPLPEKGNKERGKAAAVLSLRLGHWVRLPGWV